MMGSVVVIGEAVRTDGFTLAGVRVVHAEDGDAVAAAWTAMPEDVAVVILTPKAQALAVGLPIPPGVLTVVMPS